MKKLFITFTLITTLNGCGGDVNTIPIPTLNVDNMLADWTNISPTCVQLGPQSSYKEASTQLWWQTYTKIYNLYDNADCSGTSVGNISDTYDTDWSAPSSELTKHNAARVKLSPPIRTTEGQVPLPTLVLDTLNKFVLFYAENNLLYFYVGGMPNELDADGYPLGVTMPSAIFSK
jgi:hypothetical protein